MFISLSLYLGETETFHDIERRFTVSHSFVVRFNRDVINQKLHPGLGVLATILEPSDEQRNRCTESAGVATWVALLAIVGATIVVTVIRQVRTVPVELVNRESSHLFPSFLYLMSLLYVMRTAKANENSLMISMTYP